MEYESVVKLTERCHHDYCPSPTVCPFDHLGCEQVTDKDWNKVLNFLNTDFVKGVKVYSSLCANKHICKFYKE